MGNGCSSRCVRSRVRASVDCRLPCGRGIKLTVNTRKKECFGSAGCNVTYQVDATWFQDFDPSVTYDLTYEVRGGEDGPVVNTMTIDGDNFTHETDELIQTRSSKTKLTALVTSVEAQ